MLTLYDYLESGNGYKVRLLLTLRGIPFRRVELDILKRETRTPAFLAKNPNGRIPAVELEDGRVLFESGAILGYFAEGSELAGRDAWERAQILQWMFFEQYSHEPNVATLRFWHFAKLLPTKTPAEIAAKRSAGDAALAILDAQLAARAFLVGDRFTIADLALFAYTHVAGEGGFELARFPHVQRWIARIEALPGFVPITHDFGVPASPLPA